MAVVEDTQREFFSGVRRATQYCLNDGVLILPDRSPGAVISLVATEPAVRYLVERGDDGVDLVVEESRLVPCWYVCGTVDMAVRVTRKGLAVFLLDPAPDVVPVPGTTSHRMSA
ncbi:MAG: hypothetical protein H6698_01840 [Myxococcales bacterium]|nr:hypothetical protein [Myxococcales bacterium]MCB9533052.1 hypothetical protein [Myxococcales bacterium]